jgi:hypothetical protein
VRAQRMVDDMQRVVVQSYMTLASGSALRMNRLLRAPT